MKEIEVRPIHSDLGILEDFRLPTPESLTWREYYEFRNTVLRVLRPHGTVGPMGETPLLGDWQASERAWEIEAAASAAAPDFYVLDDMNSDMQSIVPIEVEAGRIRLQVLEALATLVARSKGWYVRITVLNQSGGQRAAVGGLFLSPGCCFHFGPLFDGVGSVAELVRRCGNPTRFINA